MLLSSPLIYFVNFLSFWIMAFFVVMDFFFLLAGKSLCYCVPVFLKLKVHLPASCFAVQPVEILVLLWNNWIQLRLQNESFEQISLNDCISHAGQSFYTGQWERRHRMRKWCQDTCLDVKFFRWDMWPYLSRLITLLMSTLAYIYSIVLEYAC
jgi:hypothetical protein